MLILTIDDHVTHSPTLPSCPPLTAAMTLAGLLFLFPSFACAQGSASEVALARSQFTEGVTAAREHRWEDALASFTRSYALSPRPVTLFNLAGAHAELGHLVEATEGYRRFLGSAEPRDAERFGAQARTALDALQPRLAHLTVTVEALQGDDGLTLDGADLNPSTLGLAMDVNPGTHTVDVTRAGASVAHEEVTLAEGAQRSVVLDAAAAVPAVASVAAPPTEAAPSYRMTVSDDASEGPHDDTALIVGLVVGAVALVAGGVVLGVVLGSPGEPASFQGTLMPGSIVLP